MYFWHSYNTHSNHLLQDYVINLNFLSLKYTHTHTYIYIYIYIYEAKKI